jgi:capsular polysaccharide transport system permease protein
MTSSSAPSDPAAKPAAPSKPDAAPAAAEKPAPVPAAKEKPKPAPKPKTPVAPVAGPVRMKRRHYGLLASFVILVLAPMFFVGGYLVLFAKDQYVSKVGFTVRREEAPLVSSLISSLGQVSSASSSDSDILFEFVRSQELVQRVDAQLDLRNLYSLISDMDPVFGLREGANIEELVDYWQRMVRVSYAPGTGLLELEVRAFDPISANSIADLIFSESSEMINELSSIAREDATRYAREDLSRAEEELKTVREALTRFRLRTQIVDPQAAIQGQMGLLNSLQQQLGEALIEFDLLGQSTREGDPRLTQITSRIAAIQARIKQERQQFGQGGDVADGQNYATVVAEFERLTVDREFAEQKYAAALSNFDNAQTEALRQSRYLAAYVGPTLAESAEYPRRTLLFLMCSFFAGISWGILALVYYSLRDRR